MMRRYLVVLCALALLLGSLPARAAGPAPVRLSPEARERFAAATAFYRAGDWAQAAREFGEASAIAAPIAEYALLQQADSLARLGDIAASRAAAQQAADLSPESRAVAPALLLAADQASRTGDDVAAAALWRRFLERFPDHAEASRARLRMGQSLVAAGRPAEAATAFRELWLTVPATPWADAAARELRGLEARGIAVAAPTPTQRIERAERVAAAGLGDQARSEAEAVLADGPPPDLALKALRVVMDGARRAGRDDLPSPPPVARSALLRGTSGRRGCSSRRRSSRRRIATAPSPRSTGSWPTIRRPPRPMTRSSSRRASWSRGRIPRRRRRSTSSLLRTTPTPRKASRRSGASAGSLGSAPTISRRRSAGLTSRPI